MRDASPQKSSLHAISVRQLHVPLHAAITVSKLALPGGQRDAITKPVHVAVYENHTSLNMAPHEAIGSGPVEAVVLLPGLLPFEAMVAFGQWSFVCART